MTYDLMADVINRARQVLPGKARLYPGLGSPWVRAGERDGI